MTPPETDVPRADSNRLDPDEPWRYACPDCGSVALSALRGGERDPTRTYPAGGIGQREAQRDREKTVICNVCKTRHYRRDVVDKKRAIDPP